MFLTQPPTTHLTIGHDLECVRVIRPNGIRAQDLITGMRLHREYWRLAAPSLVISEHLMLARTFYLDRPTLIPNAVEASERRRLDDRHWRERPSRERPLRERPLENVAFHVGEVEDDGDQLVPPFHGVAQGSVRETHLQRRLRSIREWLRRRFSSRRR